MHFTPRPPSWPGTNPDTQAVLTLVPEVSKRSQPLDFTDFDVVPGLR